MAQVSGSSNPVDCHKKAQNFTKRSHWIRPKPASPFRVFSCLFVAMALFRETVGLPASQRPHLAAVAHPAQQQLATKRHKNSQKGILRVGPRPVSFLRLLVPFCGPSLRFGQSGELPQQGTKLHKKKPLDQTKTCLPFSCFFVPLCGHDSGSERPLNCRRHAGCTFRRPLSAPRSIAIRFHRPNARRYFAATTREPRGLKCFR